MEKKKAPTYLWTSSAASVVGMCTMAIVLLYNLGDPWKWFALPFFFVAGMFTRIVFSGIMTMLENKSIK